MALTMVYIVIAVIVSIIALCIVTAIFMQHFERSHKKRKGGDALAELIPTDYKNIYILDGRFIILIGSFGDNLPNDKYIVIISHLKKENFKKFFDAMHDTKKTSPDSHMRCFHQIGGLIVDFYAYRQSQQPNHGAIYIIKGFTTKLSKINTKQLTCDRNPNYNYKTNHIKANTDKRITTEPYKVGLNSLYITYYEGGSSSGTQVLSCPPSNSRKGKIPIIIKEFIEEIRNMSSICPCIRQLQLLIKCLDEISNFDSKIKIKPNEDMLHIKLQCFYGITSFLMRAFYDGVTITKVELKGRRANYITYAINEDRVLKISIYPFNTNSRNTLEYNEIRRKQIWTKNVLDVLSPTRRFIKVEAANIFTYEIPNNTGKLPNNLFYSDWTVMPYYPPFQKEIYKKQIIMRKVIFDDIGNMIDDIIKICNQRYVYARYAFATIRINREGRLFVGEFDLNAFGSYISHFYKFNRNENLSFININDTFQCASFSFAMLLIFVINIFLIIPEQEYLVDIYNSDRYTYYILYPIVACEKIYKKYNINIFKYANIFRNLVKIYVVYLMRNEAHLIKKDLKELIVLTNFLSRSPEELPNYDFSAIANSAVKQKAQIAYRNGFNTRTLTALIETINHEIEGITKGLTPIIKRRKAKEGILNTA
jgi:hypothetical protein